MKETNEDFREVFTYSNFKKSMSENQEMKAEIEEVRGENNEMRAELKQFRQRIEDLEKSE